MRDQCQRYIDAGLVEPAAKKITEIFIKAAEETLRTTPPPGKHKQPNFHTNINTKKVVRSGLSIP